MSKNQVLLELINFIAKSGFITRDSWRKHFYTGGNDRWMYQSWKNLHLNGYSIPHPNANLKDVSVLNIKNRDLKPFLEGKPVKHVYADYIPHDTNLYEGLLDLEKKKLVEHWETEGQIKSRLGQKFGRYRFNNEKVKFPYALGI